MTSRSMCYMSPLREVVLGQSRLVATIQASFPQTNHHIIPRCCCMVTFSIRASPLHKRMLHAGQKICGLDNCQTSLTEGVCHIPDYQLGHNSEKQYNWQRYSIIPWTFQHIDLLDVWRVVLVMEQLHPRLLRVLQIHHTIYNTHLLPIWELLLIPRNIMPAWTADEGCQGELYWSKIFPRRHVGVWPSAKNTYLNWIWWKESLQQPFWKKE